MISHAVGVGQALPGMNALRFTPDDQLVRSRATDRTAISTSTTLTTGIGHYFSIAQYTQLVSLASVFDQYRIVRAEAWIMPCATTGTQGSNDDSFVCSAIDIDNAATPSTLQELENKPNCVTTQLTGGGSHYHCWQPRGALAAYSGAFTAYSVAPVGTWFDCSDTSVQHYGLKIAVDATAVVTKVNIIFRIEAEFKGVA
jgi:hypothetical protein